MSPASLAIAHRAHPDSARIAALSAAIALNLAVILIASRPIAPAQLSVARQLTPVQQIHFLTPPAVLPAPPPIVLKPLAHPPVPAQSHPRATPTIPPVVVPTTDGSLATPVTSSPTLTPTGETHGDTVTAAPVEASLAYRLAPLQFPAQALRDRMHGTVLLRVLVDETGKPLDVEVEHGSGYGLLDRSAREQVLANWRFQPAMVGGQPVRALARVPVSFDLREQ
jgi:periplasmic protein TonB